jgi:hypothetical protein
LETSWTEASKEKVDWLLNGCEQASKKIEKEVYQATTTVGEVVNIFHYYS